MKLVPTCPWKYIWLCPYLYIAIINMYGYSKSLSPYTLVVDNVSAGVSSKLKGCKAEDTGSTRCPSLTDSFGKMMLLVAFPHAYA